MKYNDKELSEITPDEWDGKSRQMLVWDDASSCPHKEMAVGYNPVLKRWVTVEDSIGFRHCAEIPKELTVDELKAQIERLKEDTKILSDGWNAEIEANNELKKENAELKEKIKSLCVERDKMAKSVSADLLVELTERCIGAKPFDYLQDELHKIAEFAQNAILEYKSERKLRRMTYKELEEWIVTNYGKHMLCKLVCSRDENEPVPDNIKIRGRNETDWHEPLIEE